MLKILLFFVMSAMMITANDGGKIFPYKYENYLLDNGLKAILIPMKGSGIIAYYSVVRTGSRDEWEPGKSGFAHFFEHMMFRGTEKFPADMYDSIVTSIGADANAYTSSDLTVYHMKFASDDLETVISIESDRFQFLRYTLEQFQTEAGAVYGEYRKNRTNPWSVVFEEMADLAYDKHTYKHTTMGFERDIKDMPNQYEYSLSFYNRYYRPSNVVLVLAGDFETDKAKALITKYYGNWKPGYVAPQIETEPEQKAFRKKEVQYEGKSLPLILLSYKSDAFSAKNKNLLSTIYFAELAFGSTSDLYKKLVLNEQKVQFIGASPAENRDPGMFDIYSMIKDEKDVDYVLAEIEKTIQQFKDQPVDETRLNNLKKRNKYSFIMGLDNPNSVASALPQLITVTGGIEVIDEMYSELEKLTPADIQNAVKHYFTKERSNLIILKGSK
ncbi:MAG: insulinase family protein [Ignavibacteriales bacterium]|nr:MAG: insulinase family protein [Ignavibacteriales bacterium]